VINLNQPVVMKQQTNLLLRAGVIASIVLLATSNPVAAAGTNATLLVHAKAATVGAAPAAPVFETEIPRSTFTIPKKMNEGKDPFFPNSTRIYVTDVPKPTPTVSLGAELTLKGISGTAEQPLAIINTTTFTTGETNEVLLKNGRTKVQCLEINMDAGTVVVQVSGERRQLSLSRGK
jgi:hypothetical protein